MFVNVTLTLHNDKSMREGEGEENIRSIAKKRNLQKNAVFLFYSTKNDTMKL